MALTGALAALPLLAACGVAPGVRADAAPEPMSGVAAAPTDAATIRDLLVGDLAAKRGDLPLAVRHYRAVAESTRDAQIAERATRIAFFARLEQDAKATARIWVEVAPDNLDARQAMAALLIRTGEADAAIPHLERILAEGEGTPTERFLMVTSLLSREEDRRAALGVMERLIEARRDSAEAMYAYGALARHAGEPAKARAAAERVIQLKPDWPDGWNLYARSLFDLGEAEAALKRLETELKKRPGDYAFRTVYARALVDANRLDAAREQFRKLAEQQPEDADVLYSLALIAVNARSYDEAQEYLLRLFKLNQRADEASYYLGQIAEQRRNLDEADRWYQRVQRGQFRMDARVRRAFLQARRGQVDEAVSALSLLRDQHSGGFDIRLLLAEGEILREAGRFEAAQALYDEGLKQYPDNKDLLYARAMLAEKVNRIDLLERDLKRILELEPDNANALNALGYTLTDRTDRHEEAYRYIRRALELEPDDAAILDSMGWVLYRLGKVRESVPYLRRALEKSADGEIAAHLGEVLWVLGDREEARRIWDRALADNPEHRILLDVMRRFK